MPSYKENANEHKIECMGIKCPFLELRKSTPGKIFERTISPRKQDSREYPQLIGESQTEKLDWWNYSKLPLRCQGKKMPRAIHGLSAGQMCLEKHPRIPGKLLLRQEKAHWEGRWILSRAISIILRKEIDQNQEDFVCLLPCPSRLSS